MGATDGRPLLIMKRIITFTSDFGLDDPFVGIVKGVILSINPDATIIDITHLIPPQDVLQAALTLRSAFRFFPPQTIHLAVVDPGVGSHRKPIVIDSHPYIFVGPDNGLFSLVLGENFTPYLIENPRFFLPEVSQTFHGRDIFAPVAAHLSLGVPPTAIGRKLESIERLSIPSPFIREDRIIGQILAFDRFGNAITNISRELLEGKKRISVKVGEYFIEGLSAYYGEKKPLTPLALIGSSGFLEIAINLASAKELLGLAKGDEVEVRLL